MGDNIQVFWASQRERIRNDAQRMYEAYHLGGKISDNAVTNILDELKARLDGSRNMVKKWFKADIDNGDKYRRVSGKGKCFQSDAGTIAQSRRTSLKAGQAHCQSAVYANLGSRLQW